MNGTSASCAAASRCRTLYDPLRPQDVDLFFALIAESRRELQARYPGMELAVVYWDHEVSEHNPAIAEVLRARKDANQQMVSEMLPPREDWLGAYQLPIDYHPTAQANQLLAKYLVERSCRNRKDRAPRMTGKDPTGRRQAVCFAPSKPLGSSKEPNFEAVLASSPHFVIAVRAQTGVEAP